MGLWCAAAEPKDAACFAEIHMAAFGPNAILQAQSPTAEVRFALQRTIMVKALADIRDPNIAVLVVQKLEPMKSNGDESAVSATEKVIGFAKWSHPTNQDSDYEETPWNWPDETALDVLSRWSQATEKAQDAAIKSDPCYSECRKLRGP